MTTKDERFAKYMESVETYIKHQMTRRTNTEKIAFRAKQIALYDDKLEHYAETLKTALTKNLRG